MATIATMDVTPQLLHDVEFREAKRGGYNTQDVDDFLERLAVGIERQDAQLREARQRLDTAEARIAQADQRAAEAERRAAESGDADESLKRTLVLAQRTADAAIKEAEDQAAKTLAAAEKRAGKLLAEAEEATARARADAEEEARRSLEEARARVLSELHDLEAARDQLRRDVDVLEAHFAEQRDRLRMTTRELQRLLDDPAALREVAVPAISDVEVPVVEEPEPEEAPPTAPQPDDAAPADWMPDDEAWSEPQDLTPPPRSAAYADAEENGDATEAPQTEAVDMLAERDADDDAYLAELRKAMTDETPLGPREESNEDALFEGGADSGRSRFGRRR